MKIMKYIYLLLLPIILINAQVNRIPEKYTDSKTTSKHVWVFGVREDAVNIEERWVKFAPEISITNAKGDRVNIRSLKTPFLADISYCKDANGNLYLRFVHFVKHMSIKDYKHGKFYR